MMRSWIVSHADSVCRAYVFSLAAVSAQLPDEMEQFILHHLQLYGPAESDPRHTAALPLSRVCADGPCARHTVHFARLELE